MGVSLVFATTIVIVVVVVRRQNLLSQLLLSLVDVCIQLISIVSDGELLVVINRDVNLLLTDWFIIWVVELCNIGMF